MNKLLKILTSALLLLLVALLYFSYILYQENQKLKLDIDKRDMLISSSLNSDSVLAQKQDSIINFVSKSMYFYSGGTEMDVDEFIRYVNGIHMQLDYLQDSIQYYKAYYELSRKYINVEFKVENIGNKRKFILIREKNIKDNREIELDIYKKAIKKYGIEINEISNKNGILTFRIEAAKVDSALLLFPYYKKRLKYDQKEKCWKVYFDGNE